MRTNSPTNHVCRAAMLIAAFVSSSTACCEEKPEQKRASQESGYQTDTIRGKVVWLADALKEEFGISTVPEVAENTLAIVSPQGEVVPIVENLRGRAFRKDERLRETDLEILARRYDRHPLIQVLRIYEVDDDGERYEIDYWCDICAIIMYEKGPCSCCQDDNRLRKRLVEERSDQEEPKTP